MSEPRSDADLTREASRKAERIARARRRPADVWSALVRVVGLGWVLALPLALGAALGRLAARWLDRPPLALVGIGVGLAAGAYGVYRQIALGLADDELEEAREPRRDEVGAGERREP